MRRLLGVSRRPTYYLPWLTRPGLQCVLLLHNIEARFKAGYNQGPFPVAVLQHDATGALVRRYEVTLRDNFDTAELCLEPTPSGHGFVTVEAEHLHSDLYVTLSDGEMYTATHGRGEFVETYPAWVRLLMGALGALLGLAGLTIPAFRRDQYVYLGAESRSHLLLLNLSNVTNRIRVAVSRNGAPLATRLIPVPPMGSHLLDVSSLVRASPEGTLVWRLGLEGNAWFNLYLVGAGPRDLAGPLSLMHVK
jgi:hypothetical protein